VILTRTFILCAAAIAGSVAAYGNLVISTPNNTDGKWFDGVPATGSLATTGPFWDNPSNDATDQCNVGYWLQTANWGTLTCGGANDGSGGPGAPLDFFADSSTSDGSKPVGWLMEANGGTQQATTLRVEVAGQASSNVLGWYTVSGNTITNQGSVFTGGQGPGAATDISIAPGTLFGFYLCPAGNCGTNLSNAFLSGTPVTDPAGKTGRFALFSEQPTAPTHPNSDITQYWVGVEDLQSPVAGENTYGDYNDMIFSVQVVPEPAFIGVLGIGLAGLALQTYRRRKQSV
jgi:hypothetical protein